MASGSRFKVYMPKENTKLTFVLAGIRAPRVARAGSGEKSEPYGVEAHKFSSKYMQRDVEIGTFVPKDHWLIIAFDSTDKTGGFIGAMYINGVNLAVELVKNG